MDALLRRRLMMQQGGGPTPPPTPVPVFYDNLIFDGTAYIDTDIVLPAGCSIRVTVGYETQKVQQRVFLASGGGGHIGLLYGGTTNTTRRGFSVYYDSSSALTGSSAYLNWTNNGYIFFQTPYRWGLGNSGFTYSKGNSHPTGSLTLGQNPAHTGQPFTGLMRTFEIYGSDASGCTTSPAFDNYTPVITLRPCTYNGEAGMWYVEQDKFYGNTAGAGTLSVSNI